MTGKLVRRVEGQARCLAAVAPPEAAAAARLEAAARQRHRGARGQIQARWLAVLHCAGRSWKACSDNARLSCGHARMSCPLLFGVQSIAMLKHGLQPWPVTLASSIHRSP